MSATRSCTCGHSVDFHQHYRRGSDCGSCGPAACAKFTRSSGTPTPITGRLRLVPSGAEWRDSVPA